MLALVHLSVLLFGVSLAEARPLQLEDRSTTVITTSSWVPNGCLLDSWNRALSAYQFENDTSMTTEMCQSACLTRGYSYAGLEAGTQCFCANWVTYGDWSSGAGAPKSDCNIACSGNSTENCGGGFRLWTYKYKTVTSTVTSVAAKTAGVSSSSLPPAPTTTSHSQSSASSKPVTSSTSKSTSLSSTSAAPKSTSSAAKSVASVTAATVQQKVAASTFSGSSVVSTVTAKSVTTSSTHTTVISRTSTSAAKSSSTSASKLPASSAVKASPSAAAATKGSSPIDVSVKKAGLGWTSDSGTYWTDFTGANGSVVGWTYDWNSVIVPGTPLSDLEFVPMAWGPGSVAGFASDTASFPALGVTSLLSFNEPDQQWQNGGADMSPSDGAKYHQQIFNSTLSSMYRIGTPAVARGSKWWLEQWIQACAGNCTYDFVPLHFYGTNAADMITYIKDFITTFGKPVWVTEYACMDFSGGGICTLAQAEAFQRQVIDYMYNEPMVERYAAFGTFTSWAVGGNPNGLENANGTANELGLLYATTT